MFVLSILGTLVLVCGIIAAPFYAPPILGLTPPQNASDWGQYVGGPFAFIALLWFVAAVFLQRKDIQLQTQQLTLQRDELELQRVELSRLSDETEKGNQIQASSNFIMSINHRMSELDKCMLLMGSSFPAKHMIPDSGNLVFPRFEIPDAGVLERMLKQAEKAGRDKDVLLGKNLALYRENCERFLFHVDDMNSNAEFAHCDTLVPNDLLSLYKTIEASRGWNPRVAEIPSTLKFQTLELTENEH